MDDSALILFPLYRWAGTTPEQFRDHYINVHSELGKRLGVTWYETFMNVNPNREWPVFGDPLPDAFTIMMFPSAEVLAGMRESAVWQNEILPDTAGFVSHAPVAEVDRYSWIPEPARAGRADEPVGMFPVYRWPGTTFDEFRAHYIDVHSGIGKRIPGVNWYESFLNRNAHAEWPVFGAPVPDAYALMRFDSAEALENVKNTPEWDEGAEDDIGFCSHALVVATQRHTWVPYPSRRAEFAP